MGIMRRCLRCEAGPSPARSAKIQLGYDMDVGLGSEPGTEEFDSLYPCPVFVSLAQW